MYRTDKGSSLEVSVWPVVTPPMEFPFRTPQSISLLQVLVPTCCQGKLWATGIMAQKMDS